MPLSEDFISAHILTEEDGGFFSSRWFMLFLSLIFSQFQYFFSDGVVSVESCPGSSGWPETLKLLEGPDYHPSYARSEVLTQNLLLTFVLCLVAGVSTVLPCRRQCRRPRMSVKCYCLTALFFLSTAGEVLFKHLLDFTFYLHHQRKQR